MIAYFKEIADICAIKTNLTFHIDIIRLRLQFH